MIVLSVAVSNAVSAWIACLSGHRGAAWVLRTLLIVGCGVAAAQGVEVDLARQNDPRIEPVVFFDKFPTQLKPLWLEALAHRESDLRREVANMIVRAHEAGMDQTEDFAQPLAKIVADPSEHRHTRLAAARALIAIEAKDQAKVLRVAAAQFGIEMAEFVEPALARWGDSTLRREWRTRLMKPPRSRRSLMLAIHAEEILATGATETANDRQAVDSLWALCTGKAFGQDPRVRLEAAGALAKVRPAGGEESARDLYGAANSSLVDRLVAATLLQQHQGDSAEELLLEIAADSEPAVAAIALQRLLELDVRLPVELAVRINGDPDVGLRELSIRFNEAEASVEAVGRLAALLPDRHPGVRSRAGDALVRLDASTALTAAVREQTTKVLHGADPLGIEIAALVLGSIDHEPSAGRMLELIDHEAAAVNVAAAWALRKLAIPATGEAILALVMREADRTEKIQKRLNSDPGPIWDVPDLNNTWRVLDQLVQALGTTNHQPARAHLIKYMPKPPLLPETAPPRVIAYAEPSARAAAVWTLGYLHAGEPNPELVKIFEGQLTDNDLNNPEYDDVRCLAAVGLARMKSTASLDKLKKIEQPGTEYTRLRRTCAWARAHIIGEPLAPLPPEGRMLLGWTLEPSAAE